MMIGIAKTQLRRRWLAKNQTMMRGGLNWPVNTLATISMNHRLQADTHQMGNEEIEREGLGKRPPGSGPGEYMHQRSGFPREFFASKEMAPVYPLLLMVSVAIGLGVLTMYRTLVLHPMLAVSKQRRREAPMPELAEDDGVGIATQSREFYEKSPCRKMSFSEEMPEFVKLLNHRFFHQPPRLPGDDKAQLLPAERRLAPADYVP